MSTDDKNENMNDSTEGKASEDVNENMVAMPLNKFKERMERVRRQVIKQYGGLTPEDVNRLNENIQQFETEKKRRQELEFEQQTRMSDLEASLARSEKLRQMEQVRTILTKCFLDSGGLPAALHDALKAMEVQNQDQFVISEEKLLFRSDNDQELSAEDFIKNFLDTRPHFRRASNSNGSSMPSAGFQGSTITSNYSDLNLQSRQGRLEAARKIVRE